MRLADNGDPSRGVSSSVEKQVDEHGALWDTGIYLMIHQLNLQGTMLIRHL